MAKAQVAEKSSGKVHVYSTLACSQIFTRWVQGGGDIPVVDREVHIAGGAGIASKNLITRMGTLTTITQEEYDAIKDLEHFKKFVESGHITVERKQAYDIDAIVSNMNPRDPGGPITPADYEQGPKDGSAPVPVDAEKAGSGWVLSH